MINPMAGRDAEPCAECPAALLREYLESAGGQWISVVIDLDYAIQAGIRIDLSNILYPEFLLLRQLAEERNRHESDELKKSHRG